MGPGAVEYAPFFAGPAFMNNVAASISSCGVDKSDGTIGVEVRECKLEVGRVMLQSVAAPLPHGSRNNGDSRRPSVAKTLPGWQAPCIAYGLRTTRLVFLERRASFTLLVAPPALIGFLGATAFVAPGIVDPTGCRQDYRFCNLNLLAGNRRYPHEPRATTLVDPSLV
jgi:hypothetical protein